MKSEVASKDGVSYSPGATPAVSSLTVPGAGKGRLGTLGAVG